MSDRRNLRYSTLQIALHWGVFLLFTSNYIVSDGMGRALHQKFDGTEVAGFVPAVHPPVGIAILVLMLIRLLVRWRQGAPEGPASGHPLMVRAAHWAHLGLYALLLAIPVTGLAAWQFGIFLSGDLHGVLANVAVALVALHAAAALFHQYVLKDNLLARMKPGR